MLKSSLRSILANRKTNLIVNNEVNLKQFYHTNQIFQKDYILGVYKSKDNQEPLTFTPSTKELLSEEFLSSPFFKKNDWKEGKMKLIDCSLFTSPQSNEVSTIGKDSKLTVNDRVLFIGLGEKENKKIPAKKRIFKEQFQQDDLVNIEKPDIRSLMSKGVSLLLSDSKASNNNNNENNNEENNNNEEENSVEVFVDNFGQERDLQDAVEGLTLGSWKFLKLNKKNLNKTLTELTEGKVSKIESYDQNTNRGIINSGTVIANAQNFCAYLAELPANYMTPTLFCKVVREKFENECPELLKGNKLTIEEHDRKWCEEKGMGSFLNVAKGSAEEPKVLEITFRNNSKSNDLDVIYLGKGITFDSGGISIKPSAGMKEMKGDMSGAATSMSALLAVCKLDLPINIKCIAMLCENMPSHVAVKPGDVITAMNGKTIEVDNTDAEGRLALADGLCYSSEFKPKHLVDIATLTGACVVALGTQLTGCYTSTNEMWKLMERAGINTKDYMWRLPMMIEEYGKQNETNVCDVKNSGGRNAGSITACVFLTEFVDFDKVKHYAHLDIAGTNSTAKGVMTGRPVRALVEYARLLSEEHVSFTLTS
ncbi:hypothetical protein ABK040_005134 [Willaertia magna]